MQVATINTHRTFFAQPHQIALLPSSTRLKQLLPVGQAITIRAVETDKYKRLVAEIYVGNRSINVNMVQEGQAVVYRQYLKSCPESKDSLLQGENTAKQQRWILARYNSSHSYPSSKY
ncbi:thermonuclease family protein [Nostoc flagelliforme]|uniref:thermonuclease family protein n=1 Tax=Nostoc flagelliforme TaxID=1306274 RepID=UPI000C2CFDEA|nr:thermonuclease family protein [Nostoc flagelliforme]